MTNVNTPPPTDEEYARLARRAQRVPIHKRPIESAPAWGAAVALILIATVALSVYSEAFNRITAVLFPTGLLMVMVAFGVCSAFFPRVFADPWDRMAQRPDLVPCPSCTGVCDVDEGACACRSCSYTYEGLDRALRRPAGDERETLDDAAFDAARAKLARLERLLRGIAFIGLCCAGVIMWPSLHADILGVSSPPSGGWHWVELGAMVVMFFFAMTLSDRVRGLQRDLATRPDLVASRRAFLPFRRLGMFGTGQRRPS